MREAAAPTSSLHKAQHSAARTVFFCRLMGGKGLRALASVRYAHQAANMPTFCLLLLFLITLVCVHRWLQMAKDDADTLPGHSPAHRHLISSTFEAMSRESGGKISK